MGEVESPYVDDPHEHAPAVAMPTTCGRHGATCTGSRGVRAADLGVGLPERLPGLDVGDGVLVDEVRDVGCRHLHCRGVQLPADPQGTVLDGSLHRLSAGRVEVPVELDEQAHPHVGGGLRIAISLRHSLGNVLARHHLHDGDACDRLGGRTSLPDGLQGHLRRLGGVGVVDGRGTRFDSGPAVSLRRHREGGTLLGPAPVDLVRGRHEDVQPRRDPRVEGLDLRLHRDLPGPEADDIASRRTLISGPLTTTGLPR